MNLLRVFGKMVAEMLKKFINKLVFLFAPVSVMLLNFEKMVAFRKFTALVVHVKSLLLSAVKLEK